MKASIVLLALVALSIGFLYTSRQTKARFLTSNVDPTSLWPDEVKDHEFKDYRFLTFGTSRTYGSTLQNRSYAYPYLLSPNVTNLAIPAAGPEVPSLCVYGMIQEQMFDVIIIEFFFHANEYLIRLVRRLRQRFPDTLFVFLVIWSPFQFSYIGDGPEKGRNLKTLIEQNSEENDLSLDTYHKIVAKYNSSEWDYLVHPRAKASLEQAIKETKGITISPFLDQDNKQLSLKNFAHLFHKDTVHFSVGGHRWMRDAILNILRSQDVKRVTKVNEWGGKDFCMDWYTEFWRSGVLKHSDNLVLHRFKENKHALELQSGKSAWIKVLNPMDKPAEVIITYMSMGPRDTKYPTIRAKLSTDTSDGKGVEIYPYERERAYMVHVVAQTTIGMIPPGEATLQLDVVKENVLPFRLTGIMVTPPFDRSELSRSVTMWKK